MFVDSALFGLLVRRYEIHSAKRVCVLTQTREPLVEPFRSELDLLYLV